MQPFQAYLWVVVGVFVAVVFPILRAVITPKPPGVKVAGIPPWLKKYGLIFIFSLVTAVIVFAIYLSTNKDALATAQWFTLFLVGFAWESTIEKFTRPA
jgi:hypothetical protein